MRKLEVASRGVSNKYRKADIIDEHVDYKSEIYAPMMRHGEHPKRWHMVIDEKNKKYKPQFIGTLQNRILNLFKKNSCLIIAYFIRC